MSSRATVQASLADSFRPNLGFQIPQGRRVLYVGVPFWAITTLAFLPWIGWCVRRVFAYRVRRRVYAGLCPHCAYDLRATPDHCPECGGAFPAGLIPA